MTDFQPAPQPAPLTPPRGWFPLGTHAGRRGPLQFSDQKDDAGLPLWERRALPPVASPLNWWRTLVVLGAAIASLIITLAAAAVLAAVGVTLGSGTAWINGVVVAALIVQPLVTLGAVAICLAAFRSPPAGVGVRRAAHRLRGLAWQLPAAVALFLGLDVVTSAVVGETNQPTSLLSFADAGLGGAIAVTVGAALLAPLWEELVFRGVLYGALRRRLGIPLSVAISAVAFALSHLAPTELPFLLAAGVLLALLRERYLSLWPGIVLHAAINGIASAGLIATVLNP